jgi:hypothetical protein
LENHAKLALIELMLKDFVDMEISSVNFAYLLDLTRNSYENVTFGLLAGIEPAIPVQYYIYLSLKLCSLKRLKSIKVL